MTAPLIVVRPEPSNAATVAAARAIGLEAHGHPLFAVEPVAWEVPSADGCAGLLAGSANVFRHGGSGLRTLHALPVHAVGETTAQAAREAGFAVAQVGSGGLQALLNTVPAGHYLRLAGEERIALTPPPGRTIDTRVVYASRPLAMPDLLADLLRGPALVLLHSGEAARHLAGECDRHGLSRSVIALACLAPRIAAAAGSGWKAVETSAETSDAALLALARQMCQNIHFGGSGTKTG